MSPLLDSLELPHWLILAGILLLIAGVTGLLIDRKKRAKIDEGADEASSEARPQLPDRHDLRSRRERRQADGDPETNGTRE
jgi:LPXTG-motif cell wall-anchored protein